MLSAAIRRAHLAIQARLSASHQAILVDFLRFGTVGAGGFIVDTAVVYSLRGALGIYAAGLIAYVFAASFTWLANRIWTFRHRAQRPMGQQWAMFLAANSMGFLLNRGTFMTLVTVSATCAEHPVIAILAGVFMGMMANFTASRQLVFGKSK